ncbi:MAG: aldo/keto reductase [Anaerolineales bacterium]|nr:aldo/keto reductase [Anaerolineales bacterium]
MQYRKFGKTGVNVSALGFGAMRLPILDGDSSKINIPEATRMLRYAIDQGVNYVDTAWGYHGEQSEPFVGQALKDGYREKVHLATKMPSWLIEKKEDLDYHFNIQMERLQTDHVDFYLLHTLRTEHWDKYLKVGIFDWIEKVKADAKVKHIGFSFHDELNVFKRIIDDYDHWDFCQIQYNFMNSNYQAGTEGLHYAADRGLGVVVMEPLYGGKLAAKPPQPISDLWATVDKSRNPAEWALRWVWDQPEVSVVLSGMSTFGQVEQNIQTASEAAENSLGEAELALYPQVEKTYNMLMPIACTKCGYCIPCPQGVKIPDIFEFYNQAIAYNDKQGVQGSYDFWIKPENRPEQCIQCGECEAACPQHLEIIEWLQKAETFFS